MSAVEHTPGPWKPLKGAEKGDDMRCAVTATRGQYDYLVATIENGAPGDFCDTEYANACLVAASPDLLAVAKNMLPSNLCLTNTNVPDSTVVPMEVTMGELREIAAVIAKATGA